jgi:photosystem II S4 domain protein
MRPAGLRLLGRGGSTNTSTSTSTSSAAAALILTSTTRVTARPPLAAWRRRLADVAASASASSSSSLRAREAKLGWVPSEHRQEVARCVDLAERAAERWNVSASSFLSPPAARDALAAIRQSLGDGDGAPAAIAWGGYAQAERCRVVVGPRDVLVPSALVVAAGSNGAAAGAGEQQGGGEQQQGEERHHATAALNEAAVVAAASISGNFLFDPATHRDFLGAVLGTGISRDKVGDIVAVTERGAVVFIDPLLVEHLQQALTSVRTVPVTVSATSIDDLRLPPPRVATLKSVEASLRLDAIASAGFRVSRAKMADLIKQGDVKLEWRRATKASVEVKQGDTISVAGKGRLEVAVVTATKNGRFAVEMVRRT